MLVHAVTLPTPSLPDGPPPRYFRIARSNSNEVEPLFSFPLLFQEENVFPDWKESAQSVVDFRRVLEAGGFRQRGGKEDHGGKGGPRKTHRSGRT